MWAGECTLFIGEPCLPGEAFCCKCIGIGGQECLLLGLEAGDIDIRDWAAVFNGARVDDDWLRKPRNSGRLSWWLATSGKSYNINIKCK